MRLYFLAFGMFALLTACGGAGGGTSGGGLPPQPPGTSAPAPSPTPSPTLSPTPAPTALLSASPSDVQLLGTTATQVVSVVDNITPSTLTIDASSCRGIATVTEQSATSILVSAVAVGTCTARVSDNHGASLSLPVSVTSTTVVLQ